jgi:hypothetical protein
MAQSQRRTEQDARGSRRRIDIVDYSLQRLELERTSDIEPYERVTVELPSGLRLPMMVLWVKAGSAGLRFLGPIAPGHMVIRSLDEAAREPTLRRTS